MVLLGYLSTDKIMGSSLSKAEKKAKMQCLFHESMHTNLEPLHIAGEKGVEMICGDGSVCLIFPTLAAHVADYPEQCLLTCAKSGTCPKCQHPNKELGDSTPGVSRTSDWTLNVIRSAQKEVSSKTEFSKLCMSWDVSGCIHRPFWEGFPFANIHESMTPDVLHQLYQGIFKHLVTWCKSAMGSSELDECI
ncbi:hypothetical protein JAAARDRAFT_128908 [Jaapia argillacea MUCL 33604]|uniref:Uncharacterized protein n=1 Tax=Jaapia argillacea MUCL 33604 TaxID=933084 RepID=A0A067Q5N8_9AGAM|nr:hypothetical protein JAAARDRAFT_128908 [Jaapia argillacea MUCL 33604]